MAVIDKDTQDYVTDSLAQPIPTGAIRILQAATLRWRTRLGSYWANPNLGSKFYLLKKDVPQSVTLAQQYGAAALQPMVNDGRLSRVVVTAQRVRKGRVDVTADLYFPDGQKVTMTDFIRVGG